MIGGSNAKLTSKFKAYLSECFHMKDLGPMNSFLVWKFLEENKVYICVNANMLLMLSLNVVCLELNM